MRFLQHFGIIPDTIEDTYKTFHFCELPGSMVYATMFYIKRITKIKKWDWNAHSLNSSALAIDDQRT